MATSKLRRNEASSSSTPVKKWRYDVFVSHKDEDTGKNFTDHLHSRLNGAGISTFKDQNELKIGEKISSSGLLKEIHKSNIGIIVFSKNYAGSTWCLDELVEIMECRKQLCQWVLPIFYHVKPSDVRKQTGDFEAAFLKHDQKEEKNKVSSWRKALAEAGELSGWNLDDTDGYEAEFIEKIVEKLLSVLNHTYLHVPTHLVGIDTRVEYMNYLLSVGTMDVRMVGIGGMGGIGKTTLAKAVFNNFFPRFECKSFLRNVGENSKQRKKQLHLQEQLLSDILRTDVRELGSVDRGIEVMKNRLCTKRVLLVLDDVDQLDQLMAFNCHSETARKYCFGPGSRIIVTTRHKHLLEHSDVDDYYMVQELDENESVELFSWHAFERKYPMEGYAELSEDVVGYCKGLPLALEVLGSYLSEFKSKDEWENALEKLKRTPNGKIQEQLRISFDALHDCGKNIFLDIACFFVGMDKDYITKVLDGCGYFATSNIGVLNRRCLLTINEDNCIIMHDLLRDMGREIVCEESVDDPGQRTRLWHSEDVLDVLKYCKGTNKNLGLALNMDGPTNVGFRAEAFSGMQNQMLLQLNYINISGGYEHLSKKLRWLCWHGFTRNSIPNTLFQMKLVAIEMQYSKLTHVWKNNKVLEKLKILDLSHSHLLTRITTNFSMLPNLEELILEDCVSLEIIDESIGILDKLVLLNLKDCENLTNLPRSICVLKSLETLVLTGCLSLDNLPEEIGEIESLVRLYASNTAIRQVPVSIVELRNLQYLSLSGCKGSSSTSLLSLFSSWESPKKFPESTTLLPSSMMGLNSLTKLSLRDCNLSEGTIPEDLGSLYSLQYLALGENNFSSLPASISNLSKLETFLLEQCTNLQSLPALPPSVTFFCAPNTSLERLPDLSNLSHAPMILLSDCSKLAEFPFTENLLQRWYGRYGGNECDEIVFPWSEIPDWFNQGIGNMLSFRVPPDMSMLKGLVLCIIFDAHDIQIRSKRSSEFIVYVTNVTKNFFLTCIRTPVYPAEATPLAHLSIGYVPLQDFEVDSGDKVEIEIDTGCELIVKKCGFIPVYIEANKLTEMDAEEVLNELNASSSNDSCMVVDEEGSGYDGNKGKEKCNDNDDDDDYDDDDNMEEEDDNNEDDDDDNNDEDEDDDYDEPEIRHAVEIAEPCHYWSYEEHTLSPYEMEVVPRQMYSRRFKFLDDLLAPDADEGQDEDDDEEL